MPLYAIRSLKSGRTLSILAETELSTEGGERDSRIFQTITATVTVGDFQRAMLFVTENFEVVASLFLFGYAVDFKETLHLSQFQSEGRIGYPHEKELEQVEVFDILTGESVAVSRDDPQLADIVSYLDGDKDDEKEGDDD